MRMLDTYDELKNGLRTASQHQTRRASLRVEDRDDN
jgi:hypothetical protein